MNTEVVICPDIISDEEVKKLTLAQIAVLCAFRCLRTSKKVSEFFCVSQKSIEMHLIRMKMEGIEL